MRRSEWLLAGYFAYVTVLSRILPVTPEIRVLTLVVNGAAFCFYFVLLKWFREGEISRHIRNWVPLAMMLLGYKEMGWLARAAHDHRLEQGWIVWDRLLLRDWRLHQIIESTGPFLPGLLEACYVLVYSLPVFTMVMLYVYKRSRFADQLLVIYLLGLLLSYVQFPFWPSEPPRTVFPNEDAPSVDTLLRHFNHWILGGYGIHTSVFPSAHVSGAVAAGFAMKRVFADRPWLYRGVFVYAALVAIATVYGRYHYAADAAAGVVVGATAAWLGARLLGPATSEAAVTELDAESAEANPVRVRQRISSS
jgi:membrane-associated phospholipid phosphatase